MSPWAASPESGDVEAAVARALAAARADGVVARLPEGVRTRLGENGFGLSGGEAQRLALARAFYRPAPLVLFDEPTAHLDPATEQDLAEAIAELAAGRTMITIAHRLATVRHADRILVLDGRRIVEAGRHEDLLAASRALRAPDRRAGLEPLVRQRGGAMKNFARLLGLYRPYAWWIAASILVSLVSTLANIGLMATSGWFITAMAAAGLAGVTMNYFTPAAIIRALAILRIGGRYLDRLVSHEATFRLIGGLRGFVFARLEPHRSGGARQLALGRHRRATAWRHRPAGTGVPAPALALRRRAARRGVVIAVLARWNGATGRRARPRLLRRRIFRRPRWPLSRAAPRAARRRRFPRTSALDSSMISKGLRRCC